MEHRQKADLSAKVLGVCRDGSQRLGRRPEEDVVEDPLILLGQVHQLAWHREYQMEVGYWQQVGCLFGNPPRFGQRLAFRTVAISARVISVALMATAIALLQVPAQVCCAAHLEGSKNPRLLP
jgi:hypothetical protein